jgi:hypothetical protein
MKEQFDFKIIDKLLGYNSASDKTNLPAGTLIRGSKNVYKKLSGTIATRPGIKRRGTVDTTEAGVKSEFVWDTNVGTTRPLRVCNNKLQVESDIVTPGIYVWYDLLITSTLLNPALTLTRFVFDTWWDNNEKTDRLLAVRGDDKVLHWGGGISKVSGGTAAGGTGAINSNSIGSGGTGYAVGDLIFITGGPTGSGGVISVTTVNGSGVVTSISGGLVAAGGEYVAGTTYSTTTNSNGGSGFTLIVNTVTTTSTLTKSDSSKSWAEDGFALLLPTEKKIIISGVEYSYSGGESGSTLYGVTPNPSGVVADSIAIQSVFAASVPDVTGYDFDFLKTINNQVWYGSYASRVIYISADVTSAGVLGFLNVVDSNSHVYGDADNIVLDNQAKGIGVKDGKVVLFAGHSDMYIITPNQNTTQSYTGTDGLTRYNFQKIEKKQLNGLSGALGHEFISNFGEYLVWLDQKNQLRALGTFSTVDSIVPTTLSLAVQTELSEDDFTGGHIKVVENTIYITAPNNARDWMYEIRDRIDESGQIISEKIWQPPQIRGISRFSVIDGVLYGHSNVNPQLYQIWDTEQWFDDHPSEEEMPYIPVMRFAYQNHGRKQGRLAFDMLYVEGYMAEGFDLKGTVYLDYQGASGIRDISISDDTNLAKFFSGLDAPSLGESSPGDNPLGDGILEEGGGQENVPKFRVMPNVPIPKNCFEYSFEFYSVDTDCRWEILLFGTNARLASENAVFLRKSNG